MIGRQSIYRVRVTCKTNTFLLAFIWCAGIFLGCCVSWCSRSTVAIVFRSAVCSQSSFFGGLTTAVLPFLLTGAGMMYGRWTIFLIAFLKSFSFGFCGYSIGLSFGAGCWLLWPLFLFIDVAVVPVCFYYWCICLDPGFEHRHKYLMCCLGYGVLIGSIDYFIISPFLSSVIR